MQPALSRSYHLRFVGDWGQANFHRICGWLCEEFCKRTGPRSRIAIWSIRAGGIEAIDLVQDGEADLCLVTPAMLIPAALGGELIFQGRAAPNLLALAVLPQNDRMVLALRPDLGIRSFEELRRRRPALRIAASRNDGTNFIGYVSRLFMQAHGIGEATLASWGGSYVEDTNPRDSLARMEAGEVDGVLQEAIMTPWWARLVESGQAVPLAAERAALGRLEADYGFPANPLPAGYWQNLESPLDALDFSDFLVLVRDDMDPDVAHLLTWCLAETRDAIERQYRHLPPQRSPLSYPLEPARMARPPVPLHAGAQRYYREAGVLS
ncbi:MAG: TAXI family TRAP transporter solute-binding subunit [Pigmentiphaga sp.]|uniref:TAXI family TRAP transporter solute-binding subunit n=1 Tax=Pigmentiphaga sp. TaxID=1977564 RepID=UPI0029B25B41|nr:TAXI family TRAP transporter solute-binding subunit [Pigmentiphaga sp.]MDX3906105.1 TAXI family TRAP transporter solute-binding subunit [Pigmentiphaga sp.]